MSPRYAVQHDASIHFVLPAELKAQITEAARAADMNVGQWLRAVARDRIARRNNGGTDAH